MSVRKIGFYGIRSPLVVDYEETCFRADIDLAFGISVSGTPRMLGNSKVVPFENLPSISRDIPVIACAFAPKRREELLLDAQENGFDLADALIDPTAILARSVRMGEASFVNAGAVIGAVSMIGMGVLINRNASLGHHVIVDDYTSIGPGATLAGNIRVGRRVVIGAGSVIHPDVRIGDDVVIAAGTVVRKNVPDGALMSGNPAKQAKYRPVKSSLNMHDGE